MGMLGFLILFPMVVAALLLILKNNQARKVIVSASALIIGIVSIVLTGMHLGTGWVDFGGFESQIVDYICTAIGIVIAVFIIAYSVKYKNIWAGVLGVIQVVGSLVFEFGFAHDVHVTNALYLDSLSLIMTLVIGIIGSGICVYALGYMDDFQEHHKDEPDRRNVFFCLMFLFLSAMFGIVFFNNMVWLFTAWEVTTLCSFLLIGYTKTDEAIKNAFRQIIMNLLGGIAFLVALFFIAINFNTLAFSEFISLGMVSYVDNPAMVAFPATLLAFAGITKAAQMPFHTWLLGAMVAPTPTSALLHSSTMVKAGVFILVKMAPIFLISTIPSLMVVLVGGLTFAFCSFLAISQSNAKRVLAYSTIANLGLIVACAGVGTPEAVWAAIFLIVFHAVAKSLLFLCVGTAEHHIGSRDIEDMDLLFEKMPRLARFMMLGIMVMFIAPFGMLIAKWATLVSFVDAQQVALIILLAFGSAGTFMFWAKWLGKLSGIAEQPENKELTVHRSEWVSLLVMVVMLIVCCIGIPAISAYMVEPYVYQSYSSIFNVDLTILGALGLPDITLSIDNLWIASVASAFIFIILFAGVGKSKAKKASVYMAGVSADNEKRVFRNSLSGETKATSRNWYMEGWFGEDRLAPVGTICCSLILIVSIAVSATALPGLF